MKKIIYGAFAALCAMGCASDVFATQAEQAKFQLSRKDQLSQCIRPEWAPPEDPLALKKWLREEWGLSIEEKVYGTEVNFFIGTENGNINGNGIKFIMLLLGFEGGSWNFSAPLSDDGYSVLSKEIMDGPFPEGSLRLALPDAKAENLNKLILCADKLRTVILFDSSDAVSCPEALDAKCNELKDHGVYVIWMAEKSTKHYEAFRPEVQ